MSRNNHHESALQQDLVRLIRDRYERKYGKFVIFAIQNARKTNVITGSILKREGVTAGVADLFVPLPAFGKHGLFIELKKPKTALSPEGKQSPAQVEFGKFCARVGYEYVVFSDFVSAYVYVCRWIDGHESIQPF